MAGTTRLKIYNGALDLCGERGLASLTENRKPRRLLDRVWDADGVRYCLEQGEWQFAMRTEEIAYDPSTTTQFGYSYAFNKPDDWVATHAVCSDPFFRSPLINYADEVDYWFADITPIYVKYVSDDEQYGGNLANWPQSFCDFVDAYFASKIVRALTNDERIIQDLLGAPGQVTGGLLGKRLKIAKSRAAMTQPTRFPANGAWVKSRYGRGSGNNRPDGGTTGSLIG